jgi:hypothetical protein
MQDPFGGPAHVSMPSVATPLLATPVVTALGADAAVTTAVAYPDAVRGHSSTPGCSPTAPLVASPSTGGMSGYAARRAPPTEPVTFKTFQPVVEPAPEPVPQQARSPRRVADADATTLSFSSGLPSSFHAAAPLVAAAPQRREVGVRRRVSPLFPFSSLWQLSRVEHKPLSLKWAMRRRCGIDVDGGGAADGVSGVRRMHARVFVCRA